VRRREFITLLGGAAAGWPLAARAQQAGPMRRIGVLTGLPEGDIDTNARLAGFRQGLERRGWFDGRNVRIDYRFAPTVGTDQAQRLANELVVLKPDVILSHGTANTASLQLETRTTPIVFVSVSDPMAQASSRAYRGRAATSPAFCSTRQASPVSGWRCLRRSRQVLSALR
jgi:putative ABC transport system substrate-binding protein